jgi:hypothetical protein
MQSVAYWTLDLYRVLVGSVASQHQEDQLKLRRAEQVIHQLRREAFLAGAEAYRKFLIRQATAHSPSDLALDPPQSGTSHLRMPA